MGLHDQWYMNAVIYCLDVETYADSNGDGVGDFSGLTSRLDYLSGLGVTVIWLMPFYPTPGRDDGYDVADYCTIDSRLGDMADFAEFVLEARERGIRVVIDMVPNHSSIEHPWFQAARSDPSSKYRDYYIWREDDPGDTSDQAAFPPVQKGIWTYDEQAKAWYLHHFHDFQPDLNFTNRAVRDEFRKILGLWLELGVSGFRIDAAPLLINLTGVENTFGMNEAHSFLAELQDFTTVRSGNAILLGEVDVSPNLIADYFGGGNELHALFNFPLNRYTFVALAQESADPIRFGLKELPSIPASGQWVNFLRHHDELNIGWLPKDQRDQVFAAFGPDPEVQVYGRGIRRRMAPMFDGDQKRLRMAYNLLFSLPGAPALFYGDELGMGDNLELPERMAVRTPMQWASYANGGFSSAPPEQFVRPMATGDYGYEQVNVQAQRSDPESLLNWTASLMRVRKECGELGAGEWTLLDAGSDPVLALRYDHDDSAVIVLTNLAGKRCPVTLDLTEQERATATDLFCDRPYPPIEPDTPADFRLNPYGYRWLRLGGAY